MTPVFCCGFECGVIGGASPVGEHWQSTSVATIDTGTVRSGNRSLKIFRSSALVCQASPQNLTTATRIVARVYVRFVTLPSASTGILSAGAVANSGPHVYFNAADSKLYARVDSTSGASGIAVTTGKWYRLDCDFNIATGGNDTADVQVEGVACGQATAAGLAAASTPVLGTTTACITEFYFDDFILSNTGADYPIGRGHGHPFVPTSDGTHNVAGTGDFARTLTGTDILNSTTTAYQLIDDVPLETGASVDWINLVAPPNATDYVECKFGAAPGIPAPTASPQSIEIICGIHQAGTGTGNMALQLNSGATTVTFYQATTVAGVTSVIYKRANSNSAPLKDGLRDGTTSIRFTSGTVVDANPDQYLDCAMIEADFVDPPPTAFNNYLFPRDSESGDTGILSFGERSR